MDGAEPTIAKEEDVVLADRRKSLEGYEDKTPEFESGCGVQ